MRLLPLLLVLAACAPAGSHEVAPDVVVVTIDTLRRDHVGVYGSTRAATPRIDRLAAEGLVFDHAVAPLPETRPSHASLFTGRYPREHGVLSNAVAFPPELATLPRAFGAAGYQTAGFAGCALFDAAAGEALGFELFDAPSTPQRSAAEVVPRAAELVESTPRDQPLFVWLHLFDPHMPYEPPTPWSGSRPGGASPELAATMPRFAWPDLLEIADAHGGDLPAPVLARARDLYAGEVEFADHELGRFLDALAASGRLERAIVVVAADHGECFEGGVYFDHSQCLGEGALAVPLVLRAPGRVASGRSSAVVELLDVAPTLLRLAGLAVPAELAGRDLVERPTDESTAFFQHPLYRPTDVLQRQAVLDRLRSVAGDPTRRIAGGEVPVGARRGDWKYVRGDGVERLADLAADGGEFVDLASREPERLRALRREVRDWLRRHPVDPAALGEADAELRARLEALGYL